MPDLARAEGDVDEPVVVLKRTAYGSRRQHWLAARRRGITATDAAAILGVDPWVSPLSLYVEKLTGTDDEDDAGEAAYWGTQLEHVVATEWSKRNPFAVIPTPGLLANARRPWQLATIDRYVATDRGAEPHAVLEVKTTGARHDEAWPADGDPPDRVVAQVQHQLIVTGLQLAYVAVLIGGQRYRQWVIERDDELCERITALEAAFLHRLQAHDPPAPIGHEADDAALAALYAGELGNAVDIEPELIERRREAAAIEKAAAEDKELLDQIIKSQLGDATEGLVDGHLAVTWRPCTSRRIDMTGLRAARPEIAEQFTVESLTRRLLVKNPPKET